MLVIVQFAQLYPFLDTSVCLIGSSVFIYFSIVNYRASIVCDRSEMNLELCSVQVLLCYLLVAMLV